MIFFYMFDLNLQSRQFQFIKYAGSFSHTLHKNTLHIPTEIIKQ